MRPASLKALAIWPSAVFVLLFLLLHYSGIDEWVAGWFFDPQQNLFPYKDGFWTRDVLHQGGRRVMLTVLAGVALLWLASFYYKPLTRSNRILGYLLLSMLVSVLAVNLGKRVSNMDCPWDLEEFGGNRPHITLFADKPDTLPVGRCFPGGHSSGGFALMALYFLARQRGWKRPVLALIPALVVGGTFSVAQWSRGAHFPSHDLTTAWLCWIIALSLYAGMMHHKHKSPVSDYSHD